jgi:ABC-2 type transport system ATP-binding protein
VADCVRASGLRVVRGDTEVLHGLDFDIRAGIITGLLGPSGCGKTTLIRTIAGTQLIAGGTLTVLGTTVGSPELRTQVAYAAQSNAVYLDLSVRENVAYFAAVLRAPSSDVARVIDAVDLGRNRDRLVGKLSGGERSRVSLAVALLGKPQLLLLDEPTVGLDPVLREELWQLFASLTAAGLSLVVSSHVMDEVGRCDDLLLMRDGRLLAHESPAALRARTGTDDLERAFLRIVRDAATDAA